MELIDLNPFEFIGFLIIVFAIPASMVLIVVFGTPTEKRRRIFGLIRELWYVFRFRSNRATIDVLTSPTSKHAERNDTEIELPDLRVPSSLVKACVENECLLYAGAGLSARSDYPTWQPFVQQLLDWADDEGHLDRGMNALLEVSLEYGGFDLVADTIVDQLERSENKSALHEFMDGVFGSRRKFSSAHKLIQQIAFCGALTTNFDNLLDRCLKEDGVPVYTPKDADALLDSLTNRKSFLVKLYGQLEEPDTIMLSPAEFNAFSRDSQVFTEFMKVLFYSRTILFIGASLEGITAYLEGLQFQPQAGGKHFAVVAVDDESWRMKANLLSRRYGIEVLPYPISEDHHPVATFLEDLRGEIQVLSAGARPKFGGQTGRTSLRRIWLRNIGPFKEFSFDISERWNVLLGDNGVGKSTILKAVAVAVCGKDAEEYAARLLKKGCTSAEIEIETTDGSKYLTQLFETSSGVKIRSRPSRLLEAEGWLVMGFPPLRQLDWGKLRSHDREEGRKRPAPDDVMPLITGEPDPRMNSVKQWLFDLDHRIKAEASQSGSSQKYARMRKDFFRIINQLTEGMSVSFKEIDLDRRQVIVTTDDGDVPIEALSQGAMSLIGWVGVLVQRYYEVYGDDEAPLENYSLILLDEIDAHMHPRWQQTIVGALKGLFPQAQFVVTTHSPLIVGGLDTEQVFHLRRDDNRKILGQRPEQDLVGMGVAGVLTSPMYGLRSELDTETQDDLDERTQLLWKGDKATAQELKRISEITEKLKEFGFGHQFRDPLYTTFIKAMAGRAELLRPLVSSEDGRARDKAIKDFCKCVQELRENDSH